MTKTNKRYLMLFIGVMAIVFTLIISTQIGSFTGRTARAEEQKTDELTLELSDMTDDLFINVNNETKDVRKYATYLEDRFQLNNKNGAPYAFDEWILNIVPIELFRQKTEYFFVGKAYGFYFNYDEKDNTYLVYLMLNIYQYCDGYLYREIRPLYYEQYLFDETNETVSLVYTGYDANSERKNTNDNNRYYYRKYSNYEKLYLKDVNFTGNLYNESHLNVDEDGYNPYQDNGGYFVKSQYNFKGVSTINGKYEFSNALLQIGLGYIPLGTSGISVGGEINVVSAINSLANFTYKSVQDFSGKISNEYSYKNENFYRQDRDYQISKFGNPIKFSATRLQTSNTSDALLLGINSDNYARNEWVINYYDRKDRWNTSFVGNVSLDVVKKESVAVGSTVKEIANDIVAVTPCTYSIDNGEKTEILLDKEKQIYTLPDVKQRIKFEAIEQGLYTFSTLGNGKNAIHHNLATDIDDNNQKLTVDLQQWEEFVVDISKSNFTGSAYVGVKVEFTPQIIKKDQNIEITLQPKQKAFYRYYLEEGEKAFDYSVVANENIRFAIFETRLANNVYYTDYDNIQGSQLAKNKLYYIEIANTNLQPVNVSLVLGKIETTKPNEVSDYVFTDEKVVEITSPYNAGVLFSVESTAYIHIKLFDINLNELRSTFAPNETLLCSLTDNEKYYLVLENYSHKTSNVKLKVDWNFTELNLGANDLKNIEKNKMYVYTNRAITAEYNISASFDFLIYDEEYMLLPNETNGLYTLEKDKNYYILSQTSQEKGNFAVEIDYTDDTTGKYSQAGVRFIKYVPTTTGRYNVSGTNNYKWYIQNLNETSGYLYAGNVYYLYIEGTPNAEFNVEIHLTARELQVGRPVNVRAGHYCFKVEEPGTYKIRTSCSNGISSTISLYNSEGLPLSKDGIQAVNICADEKEYEIEFAEGTYYMALRVNEGNYMVGVMISTMT